MNENAGSITGLTTGDVELVDEVDRLPVRSRRSPEWSTPSVRPAAADGVRVDDILEIFDIGSTRSTSWVVTALIAVAKGIRLTPALPARSSSFARR